MQSMCYGEGKHVFQSCYKLERPRTTCICLLYININKNYTLTMPCIKGVPYSFSLEPIFESHDTVMGNLSNSMPCLKIVKSI